MVNMGELFAYERIPDIEMDRVPMDDSEIERYSLRPGDLLFARQSLVLEGAGKCSIVLETPETTTFESHIIRVRLNRDAADSHFYFNYFRSHYGKSSIASIVMQVAAAGIRGSELATLLVPLPPLPVQKSIACVLCAYDNLIENNTRRIKILEQMAQMLYREWFVNFRFPGHEKVKMVDSELGAIPLGWTVKSLKDVSVLISRGISPTYDDAADGLVINQKCIRDGKLSLAPARRQSKKVPEEKMVQGGDVLINSTGVGTLGRVAQVLEPIANCTVDSHVSIVRPKENTGFFGRALLELEDHFAAQGIGSTGQTELSRERIALTRMVIPSAHLQEQFCQIIAPMNGMLVCCLGRNDILRKTRDLLLPKLVSGEISVEQIESEVPAQTV